MEINWNICEFRALLLFSAGQIYYNTPIAAYRNPVAAYGREKLYQRRPEMGNHCIRQIFYNEGSVSEEFLTEEKLPASAADGDVNWIDISGLEHRDTIVQTGRRFGVHHLIIEDILNTAQMVKMDNYDDCLFFVLKMLDYNKEDNSITSEHVSIVLKGNAILSFQENGRDIFERVRGKIKSSLDNIRKRGADYLCYELVNTIVDNYFTVIDELGD